MEKTGKYTREQLETRFKELEPVELLPGTEYLMQVFSDLSATRGCVIFPGGGYLPSPISHLEIQAYNQLTEADLEPWEVQALTGMDSCFREEHVKLMSGVRQ